MGQWPLMERAEPDEGAGAASRMATGVADSEPSDSGDSGVLDQLREAHQRVGELEARVAQREEVIRGLRRRLHDLEGPFWERRTRLDDDLDRARRRIGELERQLAEVQEPADGRSGSVATLERELAAIRATRTFRYTAAARGLYSRVLRLRGRA